MEIYTYEGGRVSLQGTLNRGKEVKFERLFRESVKSAGEEASFYSPKLKELFGSGESSTFLGLKQADGYIEKLETILNNLQESNSSMNGSFINKESKEEILYLNKSLREVLEKFPMLSVITTKLANWDIETLIGRESIGSDLLKEMRGDIGRVRSELDKVLQEELVQMGGISFSQGREGQEDREEFLDIISSLGRAEVKVEVRNSHNKLSASRVMDLI